MAKVHKWDFEFIKDTHSLPSKASYVVSVAGMILGMGLANGRRHHSVMESLIGWAHTQNDLCVVSIFQKFYFNKEALLFIEVV